jgi:chaperonin GroES
MNLKPLNDRVVVRRQEQEEVSPGGILLPSKSSEPQLIGEVLAVGPGAEDKSMTVEVGDKVLFGKYAGQVVSVDGEEVAIMREEDILAIIG